MARWTLDFTRGYCYLIWYHKPQKIDQFRDRCHRNKLLMALQLVYYDHFLNFQDNKSAIVNFSLVCARYITTIPLKLFKNAAVVNSLFYRSIWQMGMP